MPDVIKKGIFIIIQTVIMKNKLNLALFFGALLLSANVSAQRLISDSLLRHYTKNQANALFSNNGIPITTNSGFGCYRLVYETLNAQGTDTTIASGLVVVPDTSTCPMAIAMYDHGTVTQRTDVPSYLNYESLIVELIAGEGFFALGPDYLGLGVSPGFHPYVHGQSEAQAGVDLIFAAKDFAAQNNIALSNQLFLTGYSQGGHACMATHKLIQENYSGSLTVTASAPGSGPYNMSGIQSAGLANDSFYADPAYIPYLIFSYQSVYGNLYDSVSQFLQHPYDSILPPLYYAQTYSASYLDGLLPNHIDSFVVMSQLTQYMNDSANDPLRIDLRQNDEYAWVPKSPVQMTYCTEDEQVDYQNTLFTYNYFHAHGDSSATELDGGAYTHENCVTPAILNMVTLFTTMRINRSNLPVNFVVDSSSTPGGNNAFIVAEVNNAPGTTFNWSNGDTTNGLSGISDGVYIVTITDAKGCAQIDTINTDEPTAIPVCCGPEPVWNFLVYPNPVVSGLLNFTVAGFTPQSVSVYDVTGKLVMSGATGDTGKQQGYKNSMDISKLSNGVYIIEVKNSETAARTRFVKM